MAYMYSAKNIKLNVLMIQFLLYFYYPCPQGKYIYSFRRHSNILLSLIVGTCIIGDSCHYLHLKGGQGHISEDKKQKYLGEHKDEIYGQTLKKSEFNSQSVDT